MAKFEAVSFTEFVRLSEIASRNSLSSWTAILTFLFSISLLELRPQPLRRDAASSTASAFSTNAIPKFPDRVSAVVLCAGVILIERHPRRAPGKGSSNSNRLPLRNYPYMCCSPEIFGSDRILIRLLPSFTPMDSKGISDIRNETLTATGGLLGGALLGSLAGPGGTEIGAAIGSVSALLAAKFAPAFFRDSTIYGRLNNRRVFTLLKEKLQADFSYSFLTSQGTFDNAMASASTMLKEAHSTEPSIGTLESRLPRNFHWTMSGIGSPTSPAFAKSLSRLGEYCRSSGPIRVGCPAIACAAIGILRDMSNRFHESEGIRVEVSCEEINGRDFFTAIRTSCELDFAIGPVEALVLCDPDKKLPLRVLGPLFGERQRVFVSTKKRSGIHSGVWVFSRSSAKFQYLVGLEISPRHSEQEVTDARQIPDLVESIPPGDVIIAWDPVSSVLSGRRDFTVVPHSDYLIHFFLCGHRRVFSRGAFPVDDFLRVFLTHWRCFQHNPTSLIRVLSRDPAYMRAFATGAGHNWTDQT